VKESMQKKTWQEASYRASHLFLASVPGKKTFRALVCFGSLLQMLPRL